MKLQAEVARENEVAARQRWMALDTELQEVRGKMEALTNQASEAQAANLRAQGKMLW